MITGLDRKTEYLKIIPLQPNTFEMILFNFFLYSKNIKHIYNSCAEIFVADFFNLFEDLTKSSMVVNLSPFLRFGCYWLFTSYRPFAYNLILVDMSRFN